MITTQPTPPTPIPYPPATPAPRGAATPHRLVDGSQPDRIVAVTATPPIPKEITTLPPLPVLRHDVPLSKHTGGPPHLQSVLVGLALFCLTTVAVTAVYARHWQLTVHPNIYLSSAHLIQQVTPTPDKWLSLTLEGVLALLLVLVVGACAVAGYQTWIGWSWARVISVASLALTGVAVLLFDLWVLVGVGLTLLGVACVFLPDTTRYFRCFATHRAKLEETYRTPERIFYGHLPHFRQFRGADDKGYLGEAD